MSHYRFIIWMLSLCTLCGLLSGSLSAQQTKSVIVRPKEGPLKDKEVYSNSHALIVGVSKYKNLPANKQLDFADKDAVDLREVLIKSYGFPAENVVTLLNEQATLENIRKEMANLTDRNRVKENDRVLIFFSGHGQTVKLTIGGEMGFLLPYDAQIDLKDAENAAPYLSTCIKMREIWDNLQACPAKHSLLLADACFSGLLAKSKSGVETLNAGALTEMMRLPARQVITAGKKGQESLELAGKGHGAFTFKLLERLKAFAGEEGNVLMASELGSGLLRSVSNLTDGKQTPQFASYETEGEFLLIATSPQPVPALNVAKNQPKTQPKTEPDPDPEPPKVRTVPSRFNSAKPPMDAIQGDIWVNPKDGAELVYIPEGEFIQGISPEEAEALLRYYSNQDQNELRSALSMSQPKRNVFLDGYWIYKTVVTVRMYQRFCEQTNRSMPPEPAFNPKWLKRDHPIVNVSAVDAQAYCEWAGVQLPTEAQWEKAARGTDGRQFPWGNIFDRNKLNASRDKDGDAGSTCPVGRFTESPFELSDMAGNVLQWCRDFLDHNFYSTAPNKNPVGPTTGTLRILRGGSWFHFSSIIFRTFYRAGFNFATGNSDVGFRCIYGL